MLVKNGHSLILKSIMGRLPAAVTHMSFGVQYGGGLDFGVSTMNRETMGFEVIRVPIQVAYDHLIPVDESNVTNKEDFQLVYKGEIPTNNRIAFNEIGLWCGSTNARYGDSGGILVATAEPQEAWVESAWIGPTNTIPSTQETQKIIPAANYYKALQREYYDFPYFKSTQPRLGNNALALKLPESAGSTTRYFKNRIAVDYDLSLFGPGDYMKILVSWTPHWDMTASIPYADFSSVTGSYNTEFIVNIECEFTNGSNVVDQIYCRLKWSNDSNMNTYAMPWFYLQELTDSSRGRLRGMNIWIESWQKLQTQPDLPHQKFLIDGIRFERAVNNNPLYGLVFYDQVFQELTVAGNTVRYPIEKLSGFDGHIEHRARLFANTSGEIVV